jgi:sulfotransferase
MDDGIHFISGLPRAGSTLLAAILRQNPRLHAAMTSPVGAMYLAMEQAMSRRNETAVFIDESQRHDLLAGLFTNYYRSIAPGKLVFDTNRIWCTKLPGLTRLFPDARVVCCVRDVGWIMDSVERLVRRNAFELSGMFGFEPGNTVFTRVNRLASGDGLVGYALDALKEAFYGEQANRLILVEYEALARSPASTIGHLYELLGEPAFDHDFDDVVYAADEFDLALGAPGLHTIRRKVAWIERRTVLPPELFRRFDNDMFWRAAGATVPQVPIIRIDS